MKFAASTGCFYPDDIAYPDGTIPADAVETSRGVFLEFCSATPGSTVSVADGAILINPPAPLSLDQVKSGKIGDLNTEYQAAVSAPLSFNTEAGATVRFARDATHKAMVDLAVSQGEADWTANVWIDAGNSPVMPFTFVDLERLQGALAAPTSPSLMDLMAKVNAVHSASDADAVAAITF